MIQSSYSISPSASGLAQMAILSCKANQLFSPCYTLSTRPEISCTGKVKAIRERPRPSLYASSSRIEQYLNTNENDRLSADIWLEIMGDVCARPERSIIMQISHPGGELVHSCLHFRYGWAVEYMTYGQDSRSTLFRNHKALAEHIEHLWGLPNLQTPGEGEGWVNEIDFRRARAACFAGEPTLAAKILTKAGLPQMLAERFSSTLANSLVNASALCISGSPNHSLAIVGGLEGVWTLEPYQEDGDFRVRILPTDVAQVSEKILSLLQG